MFLAERYALCVRFQTRASLLPVPIDQVKQREQINPDNVDEVPVQADDVDRIVVFGRKASRERFLQEPEQKSRANDHVQRVKTGHAEIGGIVELGMSVEVGIGGLSLGQFLALHFKFRGTQVVAPGRIIDAIGDIKIPAGNQVVMELLSVLDVLHAKENETEQDSEGEKNRDKLFLADLGGPYGHGHGEAAGQENHGIEAAQKEAEGVAAHGKRREVRVAVDGVGQHNAAEEHDFRHEEDPHSERGGALLLLQGLDFALHRSGAVHSALL